ncbi:hypothetical protein OM076_09985 [Solirubrobacter ginsenosidimutans]|uniref:Uncharacterized protein n=1 Tax=Solirubrobacter ginsenosidimutans TaxID=490573 RepID=A0A9X3MSV3_9ACTN|nr:hypothetical protein [Solirubrobacter ginsenosidimutans]MDA0160593.1 hypothetical protein [Solirubrobacter ginsenosidimutans]
MLLRIDPWNPEYGSSVELDIESESAPALDLTVEVSGPWAPFAAALPISGRCCAFVDGARRIDANLFAEENDLSVPALAGTWAVGCAWSSRPPVIDDVRVGRALVVGGGLTPPPPLEIRIGTGRHSFTPSSVTGSDTSDPLRGLQNAMRAAEGDAARVALESGRAELVVVDGPLGSALDGAIVGMVKRQSRTYLDRERARVVPALQAGERTPMFKLSRQQFECYSWYLRLTDRRAIDGAMAGIVRVEVAAQAGLPAAQALAELVSGVLPQFAGDPARDPRAPQNLYPVGALESVLRHRLGDPLLVRRAIEAALLEEITRV